ALRIRPTGTASVRLTVSASRATGGAVRRNRAKRRVREALRIALRARTSLPGIDIVAVARPSARRAPAAALQGAAARLVEKAARAAERPS
ncbi:MAG: ribonuclease P protein component, partial [Chloroflexi bacterium]|nr:ribonuclease P protein component [Chloroflexota bacterium]